MGAELALSGGVALGKLAGLSERVIAITIISVGTGLPELATSIAAAYRGHSEIAIANVIGSNIFNTLAIPGVTASFFALPIALQDYAGLEKSKHALAYLPILIVAFICMVPFILIAEKRHKMKPVFIGAIIILGIAQLGWALLSTSLIGLLFSLWLFFTAFNILEASLPSLMSKLSPLENKGTAMGIYSSAQFIGAFMGGALGGLMFSHFGLSAVFLTGAILTVFWLMFIVPMQPPRHFSTRIIHLDNVTSANAHEIIAKLNAITGVVEAIAVVEEQVAYVKISPEAVDTLALDAFCKQT